VTAQWLLAGMAAPDRVTLLIGADRVPPQLVAGAGELLTVKLLGNVIVNPTAVSAYAFELLSVTVSVELAFCPTLEGANASATVGGCGAVTVSVAVLAVALPPAGPVIRAFAAIALL
jgi:hypothetical protein